MSISTSRRLMLFSLLALVALGLAWELWLAPLRSGGSMLALKVIPLLLLLPGIWKSNRRSVQMLSLVIQIYLTEGLVRATSDPGFSAQLAALETLLATITFGAALYWAKQTGNPAAAQATAISTQTPTTLSAQTPTALSAQTPTAVAGQTAPPPQRRQN